jgi:hypothetical protein
MPAGISTELLSPNSIRYRVVSTAQPSCLAYSAVSTSLMPQTAARLPGRIVGEALFLIRTVSSQVGLFMFDGLLEAHTGAD